MDLMTWVPSCLVFSGFPDELSNPNKQSIVIELLWPNYGKRLRSWWTNCKMVVVVTMSNSEAKFPSLFLQPNKEARLM